MFDRRKQPSRDTQYKGMPYYVERITGKLKHERRKSKIKEFKDFMKTIDTIYKKPK